MAKKINITAAILSLVLAMFALIFTYSYLKPQKKYETFLDPDTGATIIDNGHSEEKASDSTEVQLLSDKTIFDLGLKSNEFFATREVLSEFIKKDHNGKFKTAAINRESVKYSEDDETFSFIVRLGQVSSKEYVTVTVSRVKYNILSISIYKNSDRVYHDASVKINKRL